MNDEYEILIFKETNGRKPFDEWFKQIKDKKTQNTIVLRLQRIRQGNLGNCKALGKGLHELKIDYGPGLRVYFGIIGSKLILLLGGGDKGSQSNDVKICLEYLKLYKDRI